MNTPEKHNLLSFVATFTALVLLFGCGGPEAKKMMLYGKGKALYEKGDYVRARLELKNALQIDPKFAEAYCMLGMVELKQGKLQGAFGAFSKATSLNPLKYDAQVQLGKLFLLSRALDKAGEKASLVLKAQPRHEEGLLLKGAIYLADGDVAGAVDHLRAMERHGITRPDLYLLLASAYRQMENAKEAEQALLEGLTHTRDSLPLHRALSDLYIQTGRSDKGVATLKEYLRLEKDQANPRIIDVKNDLARIYMGRGELTETLRLLEEIFNVNPRNLDANLTRGRLAMLKGEGDKAVAAFQIIVNDKPKQVWGYLLLAEALLLNRKPDMALETLQQARKLEPDSLEVIRAFARFYSQQRDFRSAEGCLRKVLAKNPNDPELQIDLGDLFRMSRAMKQAEAAYTAVKRSSRGAIIGRVKLSELYQETGRLDRATAELSQAVDMDPQSEYLFARLISIRVKQQKYAEATAKCRERINKRPQEAMTYYLLGGIMELRGDYRKAEESLLQAQKLAGNSAQIGLALAQLQVKEGKLAKARKVYEDILTKHPDSWAVVNDFACMLTNHGNGVSDLQRAMTLAQQANSRFPDNPLIMDTLGWVCYRKGDYQRAAQLLEKAAEKLGDKPLIRYHTGMALYRSGKANRAKEHLRFAAESRENFNGKEEAIKMAGAGR